MAQDLFTAQLLYRFEQLPSSFPVLRGVQNYSLIRYSREADLGHPRGWDFDFESPDYPWYIGTLDNP